MAWPPALNVIPVHIKIVWPNAAQTPAIGRVVFDMPFPLRDALDSVIIGPIPPIVATLDENGEATIELPATNDPQITPINWTYLVKVETDAYKQQFPAIVPYDHVGILEFDTMPPAVTPPALIVYALVGHTHTDLIPKSIIDAKGDLLVGTAADTPARLPAGVNGRVLTANSATATGLEWLAAASGTGLLPRGVWDPGTVYNPGDAVFYRNAIYLAVNGAAAGVQPVVETTLITAQPPSLELNDQTEYQFLAQIQNTTPMPVRLTGLGYHKAADQNQVPHEMRVYDMATPTSPVVSVLATDGAANSVGHKIAPVILDIMPAVNYAITLVTGAGTDKGYFYQLAFPFPLASGAINLSAGGFAQSHANISVIQQPTNLYSAVTPRWEQPSPFWTLLARIDPIAVGTSRVVTYARPLV